MFKILAIALLPLLAQPAQAADQSYKIFLGGTELGWFRYSGSSNNARISSVFDNTPLGVFDGSYEGTSRTQSGRVVYHGKSVSSNKNREVEIVLAPKGNVRETMILPAKDQTDYSVPSAVPTGVLDPVAGFGQFLSTKNGCPEAFTLYDGRRVVQVTPKSSEAVGSAKTCVMDYRVMLGKGHLSPLYLKHITVTVTFDPAVAETGPSLLSLRSGLFGVEFRRD